MASHGSPPIWFMSGMSTLSPYNVSLVLMVNHYCSEPSRSKYKLAVVLWECIKYKNLSLNQLIALLNELDDSELGEEFLEYLDKFFRNATIGVLKKLIGNRGSAYNLMGAPEELIKPSSPFGLFLRHMIISFELASFEQLSSFLKDMTAYIENKDTVCPLNSPTHQEAAFCREVAKFQNSLSLEKSNSEIHQMCVRVPDKARIQQSEFLQYLNYLSIKEYNLANKHLHQYFTIMLNSGDETKNIRPFSALNSAAMHTVFGHNELAMQYLKESIHLSQLLGEEACLSHCIAWTSYLHGAPISRPTISTDSEAVPTELEILGHGHTIETMCEAGDDPTKLLEYMCKVASISSPAQYHTNAARIFKWYGNSLLQELHPFFAVLQLCPSWLKDGHMISFSNDATSLCAALCNLALSLSQSTAPPVSSADLLSFIRSLFPSSSSHTHLILLTLNKINYLRKTRAKQSTESEEALVRTISASTHAALTCTDEHRDHGDTHPKELRAKGDAYTTSQELRANVLYNSAKADLPCAPSRAIEKLLTLILHCRSYHLREEEVRAHLLLTEAQVLLHLFDQALNTIESVFVEALSTSNTLVQASARWLYVQAKMATTDGEARVATFRGLERHIKLALECFVAHTDVRHVCDVLYYLARLYHEFGLKDDRNKCAKRFRNYRLTLTLQDPL